LLCPVHSWGQNADTPTQAFGNNRALLGIEGKFSYYITEAFLNSGGYRVAPWPGGFAMRIPARNGDKGPRRSGETTGMRSRSVRRFKRRALSRV